MFDVDKLEDLEKPGYTRSVKLIDAIQKNDCYELCGAKYLGNKRGQYSEILIVILTCDGVPDRNQYGIGYKERIGIVVSSEEKGIPEVWALRDDFPKLLHMNDAPAAMPNNICLYFENKIVINRTWTAERFLKRIYWWMEMSAKGILHTADQPLEQLFFDSEYELVLPKECGQNIENINEDFYISHFVERKNGTCTYFIELEKQDRAATVSAHIIYVELPPVVHATISSSPRTLSELCESTSTKEFSTKEFLKEHIQSLVPSEGVSEDFQECRTVVLIKIPIARISGGEVERIQLKAFIAIQSPFEIGEKSGFLFKSPEDNKLYKELNFRGGADISTDEIYLRPVEVLKMNSKDDFAEQSGSSNTGGEYVLVGLGALGSALIDLWNRAGWGAWTLIDKDHIKPHNLTRHTAGRGLVGWNKAAACAALVESSTGITEGLTVLENDVMSDNQDIVDALSDTDLVIDVSTTLDYPRSASFNDDFSRHCSLFITPKGLDSVLLMEDEKRACRLRSIEAQYYRAILNNDWGENHLSGHLGNFVSGASCRDISLKMQFSSVMCHASILCEQVMSLSEKDEAQIQIWKRDIVTGAVEVISCQVSDELYCDIGGYQVIFDKGLEEKLNVLRNQNLPCETGGILLGYHDLNLNSIFIVDALPAPSDSISTETEFQRGSLGTLEALEKAKVKTANIIDYVGEWHSHPVNVKADPSMKDVIQLTELSKTLSEDGLPAIQLIVGEDGVNIIIGEVVDA